MMELAREFGLALQTVNIVRGIPSDIRRGWFFVPRDFLPAEIEGGEDFLAPDHRREALVVVDRLLEKASRHFLAAEEYILRLPRFRRRMRYFCLLPYFFGIRTLALSRGNEKVLESEVKLSRAEVRSVAARSRLWSFSNAWIRRYGSLMALMARP
jgi:phytoene/squalene synthetase